MIFGIESLSVFVKKSMPGTKIQAVIAFGKVNI